MHSMSPADSKDVRGPIPMEPDLARMQDAESASEGSSPSDQEPAAELGTGATRGFRPGWPVVDWLPVLLAVGLPVPAFRVRDLLALEVGSVVSTEWPNGDDLPLSAGTVQLAWVDMEAVEQVMAVRLTRVL
ncbi:MAG TPA: FliM/FliN family flagellar motor C-terminal domain-containing protein [Acidobacteriaceae bacterium]|nr:FliM/FliN family flagellar motor C-terminal domain-containing protein [Acidobacteriaceae bacterium]